MKLQVPFIQLPLAFDADVLAAEIAAIGEGAVAPASAGLCRQFDAAAGRGRRRSRPTRPCRADAADAAPAACPYLTQVFASLGATGPQPADAPVRPGRSEAACGPGYYWRERVRVHVPIVTQPTVRFKCGEAEINMAAGECWIFDTWRQHRVVNDAADPASTWSPTPSAAAISGTWSAAAGRTTRRGAGWQPRALPPQPGAAARSPAKRSMRRR